MAISRGGVTARRFRFFLPILPPGLDLGGPSLACGHRRAVLHFNLYFFTFKLHVFNSWNCLIWLSSSQVREVDEFSSSISFWVASSAFGFGVETSAALIGPVCRGSASSCSRDITFAVGIWSSPAGASPEPRVWRLSPSASAADVDLSAIFRWERAAMSLRLLGNRCVSSW